MLCAALRLPYGSQWVSPKWQFGVKSLFLLTMERCSTSRMFRLQNTNLPSAAWCWLWCVCGLCAAVVAAAEASGGAGVPEAGVLVPSTAKVCFCLFFCTGEHGWGVGFGCIWGVGLFVVPPLCRALCSVPVRVVFSL